MNSQNFWKFLVALGAAFALPWLLLVVLPYVGQAKATPVPYADDEPFEGAYPDPVLQRHGASDFGRRVYAAEGCAYCHTQVVRPTYAGPDRWRKGWGGRETEEQNFARETHPGDWANEDFALLGYQRVGQDLANVGGRMAMRAAAAREAGEEFDQRAEMHRHLLEPKSFDPDSGMPAYKHLYRPSPTGEGYVPTTRAIALVDYLLSLKKDQPLPAAISGSR